MCSGLLSQGAQSKHLLGYWLINNAQLGSILNFLVKSTSFVNMEVFKFFGSIKSLRGFSAPDSLVAISRLGYGVLGLAATKVAMEIIPGFMIIKALDKLLPSPRRLTKEVSLGRILSDTQE